jgi:hypothetical protein
MAAVDAHVGARNRIVATCEGQLIADTSPAPIITAALWSWHASQLDGANARRRDSSSSPEVAETERREERRGGGSVAVTGARGVGRGVNPCLPRFSTCTTRTGAQNEAKGMYNNI